MTSTPQVRRHAVRPGRDFREFRTWLFAGLLGLLGLSAALLGVAVLDSRAPTPILVSVPPVQESAQLSPEAEPVKPASPARADGDDQQRLAPPHRSPEKSSNERPGTARMSDRAPAEGAEFAEQWTRRYGGIGR